MPAESINFEESFRRSLIWLLLFSIPILLSMDPPIDPDIWWHLRVGQWIVEHGRVPYVDVFSSYGAGKPWIAYSWLFDVLVFFLHRQFGLLGIVAFNVAMALAIAVALYLSVRQVSLPILAEVALVGTAIIAMAPIYTPRPWAFTILFFILELNCIFAALRHGQARPLYYLAPLFVLWANLHIQFVYGLAVFGLYILELLLARIKIIGSPIPSNRAQPHLRNVLLAFSACIVATLITPYNFNLYKPVFEYVVFTGVFQIVTEFFPLSFQSAPDWLVGLLLLASAFVLGWQRRLLIFPTALLLLSAFLGIRARRDVWFPVVSAVLIITQLQIFFPIVERYRWNWLNRVMVGVGLCVAIFFIAHQREISTTKLQQLMKETYPVDALTFIKEKRYAGPLYNHFNWGGYLIWALPEIPVSIDGRTNLHGDARISRSVNTWLGKGWESDPELAQSRLVISHPKHVLASLLRADERFRLVYEDNTALVFVANGS